MKWAPWSKGKAARGASVDATHAVDLILDLILDLIIEDTKKKERGQVVRHDAEGHDAEEYEVLGARRSAADSGREARIFISRSRLRNSVIPHDIAEEEPQFRRKQDPVEALHFSGAVEEHQGGNDSDRILAKILNLLQGYIDGAELHLARELRCDQCQTSLGESTGRDER